MATDARIAVGLPSHPKTKKLLKPVPNQVYLPHKADRVKTEKLKKAVI